MTIVYRVEHKSDGKGPYSHPWSYVKGCKVFRECCNTNTKHKSIEEDKIVKGDKKLLEVLMVTIYQYTSLTEEQLTLLETVNLNPRFCTTSLNILKSWFDIKNIVSLLDEEGFNLVTYEVEEENIVHFETQSVIIDIDKAVCINCESITTLYSI